jgi:hypothetical protein
MIIKKARGMLDAAGFCGLAGMLKWKTFHGILVLLNGGGFKWLSRD